MTASIAHPGSLADRHMPQGGARRCKTLVRRFAPVVVITSLVVHAFGIGVPTRVSIAAPPDRRRQLVRPGNFMRKDRADVLMQTVIASTGAGLAANG